MCVTHVIYHKYDQSVAESPDPISKHIPEYIWWTDKLMYGFYPSRNTGHLLSRGQFSECINDSHWDSNASFLDCIGVSIYNCVLLWSHPPRKFRLTDSLICTSSLMPDSNSTPPFAVHRSLTNHSILGFLCYAIPNRNTLNTPRRSHVTSPSTVASTPRDHPFQG